MTVIGIIQGLFNGRYRPGDVAVSRSGVKFEMISQDRVKIRYLNGREQTWKLPDPDQRPKSS